MSTDYRPPVMRKPRTVRQRAPREFRACPASTAAPFSLQSVDDATIASADDLHRLVTHAGDSFLGGLLDFLR